MKPRCERCETKTATKALEGLMVRDKGESKARAFRACVACAKALHRFARSAGGKVRGYRLAVDRGIPFLL